MPERSPADTVAAGLTIAERVMLFCLASNTNWEGAGIRHAIAQRMLLRGLINRDSGPARFKLTPMGRAVFAALIKPPADEQDG
jgi:hypothetical protein